MFLKPINPWIIFRYVFWLLFIVVAIYLPFFRDLYISADSLDKLFQISITISSILFGVLGIWISTVYGESLSVFIKGDKTDRNDAINNVEILIIPLLFSFLCILVGVCFFIFKVQLSENFDLCLDIKVFLLQFSFTIYCLTTALQFWYLTSIFKPLLSLSFKMEREKIKDNMINQHFKPNKK